MHLSSLPSLPPFLPPSLSSSILPPSLSSSSPSLPPPLSPSPLSFLSPSFLPSSLLPPPFFLPQLSPRLKTSLFMRRGEAGSPPSTNSTIRLMAVKNWEGCPLWQRLWCVRLVGDGKKQRMLWRKVAPSFMLKYDTCTRSHTHTHTHTLTPTHTHSHSHPHTHTHKVLCALLSFVKGGCSPPLSTFISMTTRVQNNKH